MFCLDNKMYSHCLCSQRPVQKGWLCEQKKLDSFTSTHPRKLAQYCYRSLILSRKQKPQTCFTVRISCLAMQWAPFKSVTLAGEENETPWGLVPFRNMCIISLWLAHILRCSSEFLQEHANMPQRPRRENNSAQIISAFCSIHHPQDPGRDHRSVRLGG